MRYVVEAAAIRDAIWGATLATALARHLWLTGDYEGARHQYQSALSTYRQYLGEEHPDTAEAYRTVGFILRELGDLAASRHHLEQSLTLHRRLFGERHISTIKSLDDLGQLNWVEDKYEDAIQNLTQAYAICKEILEPNQEITATVANNLALCLYDSQASPTPALPYLEEALQIRRIIYGEEHPFTALIYHNLASVQEKIGLWNEAEVAYARALAIRRKALGENHPDTAHTLTMLGTLLSKLHRDEQGRSYLEQALTISLQTVGVQHIQTAVCDTHLGLYWSEKQNWKKARFHLERALNIREHIYQGQHPAIASTLEQIGMILSKLEDRKAACEYLTRSVLMYRALYGDDHPRTVQSQMCLESVQDDTVL
jgi:tetratricopeptide (TPR) repeat protein